MESETKRRRKERVTQRRRGKKGKEGRSEVKKGTTQLSQNIFLSPF